ncbi:MAG: hypothetical protein ACTSV7_03350 [Candidatus Baldrarchaeia archaeon]
MATIPTSKHKTKIVLIGISVVIIFMLAFPASNIIKGAAIVVIERKNSQGYVVEKKMEEIIELL